MKVHIDLRQTWVKSYTHGDFVAIHRSKKISVITAKRAIETGICSVGTMKKINEFYIEKNKRPDDIINKINGSGN